MNALIIVDVQNDFLPGGALAVPKGNEIIEIANAAQASHDLVVATQDWHPRGHGSFASSHAGRKVYEQIQLNGLPQTLWPDHCVQESRGAEFAESLYVAKIARVFRKGIDPGIDSYSGFFDNGRRRSTGLGEFLRERGVTSVSVLGLATDYCVLATALDAVREGLRVTLLRDGCRGVDVSPGDSERAIERMRASGVIIA